MPERITTSVVAEWPEKIFCAGLVAKVPCQFHLPRYEYVLSKKGEALSPVLQKMCR